MNKILLCFCFGFLPFFMIGQTEIFNVAGGGAFPTNWVGTNNVTSNAIDRSSYYLLDAGSPSDVIETDVYDLSGFTSATFDIDIASFGSGSNNSLTVEISDNGGTSYSQVETTINTNGSSPYLAIATINIASLTNQVKLRFTNSGTSGRGVRMQNFLLQGFISCTAPSTQATNFGSASITANSMDISWTRGDGDAGVIVVAREGSAVDTDPMNGTTYTGNAAFGNGDEIGTGNFVVYIGTGTTVSVSSLNSGTTYHFAIYEYNTASTCYNVTELTGNATTITLPEVGFTSTTSSVNEGDSGTSTHTVSVTMTLAPSSDATVDILSFESTPTSATEGADYVAVVQSIDFLTTDIYPATKDVSITINGDSDIESDETFELLLGLDTGSSGLATEGTVDHTVTITNDDLPNAIINEFEWDEDGGDVGEFIEIFIANPQPGDLTQYTVEEYETSGGSAGNSQGTHTLDEFTAANGTNLSGVTGTFYTLVEPFENDDAVALCGPSGVIQFLHTGSVITASNGCAAGSTSTAIGVDDDYPVGSSAQRQANGTYAIAAETPGAINAVVLPIELITFQAQKAQAHISLTWQTATELNNDYIIIEHSTDAKNFQEIGMVDGAGTTFEVQNYNFVDRRPVEGMNYYRLRQVDFDGTENLSRVVSVEFGREGALTIFPNPTSNELTVKVPESWEEETSFIIYDFAGKVVRTIRIYNNQETLDLNSLTPGFYQMTAINGNAVLNENFVKQ